MAPGLLFGKRRVFPVTLQAGFAKELLVLPAGLT
jgi:hypothetical protein